MGPLGICSHHFPIQFCRGWKVEKYISHIPRTPQLGFWTGFRFHQSESKVVGARHPFCWYHSSRCSRYHWSQPLWLWIPDGQIGLSDVFLEHTVQTVRNHLPGFLVKAQVDEWWCSGHYSQRSGLKPALLSFLTILQALIPCIKFLLFNIHRNISVICNRTLTDSLNFIFSSLKTFLSWELFKKQIP